MPKTKPFEQYSNRYEDWFARHPAAYQSELAAVRDLWPGGAFSVEIGVGAGNFSGPLEIHRGLEPALAMRKRALARGIEVVDGIAESLPFLDGSYDATLMVTTICFVDDPDQSIRELFRILRPGGYAVLGFLDRESPLGIEYDQKRTSSLFYGIAAFFSTSEIRAMLEDAGFVGLQFRQTLFNHPDRMKDPDPVRVGYGEGSFVVVRGRKPEDHSC